MDKESRTQRVQLGCGLLTCLTMLLALCGAGLVFGLDLNGSGFNMARLGARDTVGPAVNRLALVAADGNVYIVDHNGESRVAITNDAVLTRSAAIRRAYVFPNWARDNQHIAFVGVSSENTGTATLYTATAQGSKPLGIYSSSDNLPFYLSWSPDSKHVAFLAQGAQNDLSLNYANADGSGNKELGKGSPLYFSWSPDSQSLLSHVGGSHRESTDAFIGLHVLASQGEPRNLSTTPADFLAPAWSPNGREFLSALTGDTPSNDTLIASDSQGQHPRTLAHFAGSIYFAWSPDGSQVAYLRTQDGGSKRRTELHVVQADGGNDRVIIDDSPLVFFWSPDSQKIAYLVQAIGDQGRLIPASSNNQQPNPTVTWKAVTIAGHAIKTLSTFMPSDSFASVLPYFDQYAQSLRLWSPDSKEIVFGAQEKDGGDSVYVVNVEGDGAPRRISDGGIAVWSWN